MADEGFVIGGRTYPFPSSFRLCDPVLVKQITGLSWTEFAEMLEDSDHQDPALMAGMIGVAVWQANPRWPRERIARFVEQLEMDAVEVRGGDAVEADPDDPTVAAAEPVSSSSPAASNPAPEPPSDPSSPTSTGEPGSDTASLASLLTA